MSRLLWLCLVSIPMAWAAEDQVLVPFRNPEGKWGFRLVPKDDARFRNDGYALSGGEIVIPAEYAWVSRFSEGLARVTKEGAFVGDLVGIRGAKWGFIDPKGREVIPFQFTDATGFVDGYARVELDGQHGMIDKTGTFVVPPRYHQIGVFSCGLAIVRAWRFGYCDKTGKEVIALKYERAGPFLEDRARVQREQKVGWIDTQGREIALGAYEQVSHFQEGLAGVRKNGKWGFADREGNLVIEPAWDAMNAFSKGLAAVKANGKYGYIDKTGKVVAQPRFDSAGYFTADGLAVVWEDKEFAFVRRNGEYAFPLRFTHANEFREGKASVLYQKQWHTLFADGRLTPYEGIACSFVFRESDIPADDREFDPFAIRLDGGDE